MHRPQRLPAAPPTRRRAGADRAAAAFAVRRRAPPAGGDPRAAQTAPRSRRARARPSRPARPAAGRLPSRQWRTIAAAGHRGNERAVVAFREQMPGALDRARRPAPRRDRDEHAAAMLAPAQRVDGGYISARERQQRRQQPQPHQPGAGVQRAMQDFRHRARAHPDRRAGSGHSAGSTCRSGTSTSEKRIGCRAAAGRAARSCSGACSIEAVADRLAGRRGRAPPACPA